jgi:hypothetical protein
MLLPELQSLRAVARLLALKTRREVADGNATDALHDVARIQRIGRHSASEPLLISSLVGLAIDALALETFAQVLPTLGKSDLAALDSSDIRDLVTTPPAMASHYYGEEAFGLSTFAGMADSRFGVMNALELLANQPQRPFLSRILPLTLLYRVFFLEADLTGYRSIMHKYQQLAAGSEPYPEVKKKTDAMEKELWDRSPGMMSSLIVPALGGVFRTQAQSIARQRAASALVAATRQRLETGTTPCHPQPAIPSRPTGRCSRSGPTARCSSTRSARTARTTVARSPRAPTRSRATTTSDCGWRSDRATDFR